MLADREAFSEDQDPYEEEVVLPGIASKMSLNQALRMITAQIGNGQATFVVRQSHVEITTQERATAPRILQSTIVASFERRSLKDVLDQLADDGGLDVHLDPNVGKTADTLITAKFRNVSLESALVTVTEMAELKFVTMDRSVFVTTPEKANGLRIEERERAKSRKELDSKVPPKAKNLEPPAR
jgi:hypothetical protein